MTQAQTLADWLTHCERIHPQHIELGLERVREVQTRLGLVANAPVITVAGTNGKGSSCAMLEAILGEAGYRTGVYTSPHLIHFEERCRIQGDIVTAEDLLPHFARVEAARISPEPVSLTYFEFTTLAILSLLAERALDVWILEVGLGGRLDAVNLFDADCALITSIDLDHTDWLGPDRESIGREKAGIMRPARPVVVSDPVPPESLRACAAELGSDMWCLGRDFNFQGDKQQWGWAGRGRRYSGLAYPALRGANQLLNASGVLAVLEVLRPKLPVTAQAVRNGLAMVALPGRFQIVPGQPTLVLDVAHNPHAAAALAENLDAMGFFPRTHAVVGIMADKELGAMFERLNPIIDHWYFCDLPLPRAASAQALQARWLETATRPDASASTHASARAALDAALAEASPTDRIVVFGSFHTVGGVLEAGLPARSAPHLSP